MDKLALLFSGVVVLGGNKGVWGDSVGLGGSGGGVTFRGCLVISSSTSLKHLCS